MAEVNLRVALALMFTCVLASLPLRAHHGSSMFLMKEEIAIQGTVTAFEFVHPHVKVTIAAKGKDGGTESWTAEGDNVNSMHRAGWRKDSLKVGDQITLTGHPARGGRKLMYLMKVTFPDGRVLAPRQGD
jgi:hypothetical protein